MMTGAFTDLRNMELALTGLRTANDELEQEVERLHLSRQTDKDMIKTLKREKAAELRALKDLEAARWSRVMQESNSKIQQDCQRQLLSQRQKYDREMSTHLARLRLAHQAELRTTNLEHRKAQDYLQLQIKELKESKVQKVDALDSNVTMERDRLIKENKIIKEEKKHLEEIIQRLTESERRNAAEMRQTYEDHQMELNRLRKLTKQEGIQMLQTLKARDRQIECLRGELTSRKRKRPTENEAGSGEGGGIMAPSAKRGPKTSATPKKNESNYESKIIKEQQEKINKLEIMLKEKTEKLDSLQRIPSMLENEKEKSENMNSIEVTPLMLETNKNVALEEEFSSLTSQDSGITQSVPDTPTEVQPISLSNECYTTLVKEHEVLQRSYQLLRLWIIQNTNNKQHDKITTQHDNITKQHDQKVMTKMGNCQQKPDAENEDGREEENCGEEKAAEQRYVYEQEVAIEDENSAELEQLKTLLEQSHKELHELREQNELMEFRVLELETQPTGKCTEEDVKDSSDDTSDLWESCLVVTEHMNQLDIFIQSDAEPNEKADAVQEWLDEALSEAWITPVCQQSLVRITNVLRILQNRLVEAEAEVIQGPRYYGSLETILEEKEEPPKDTSSTQTEDDKTYLSQKLVRQLEDDLTDARHQVVQLSHENASLHEQLSNIHEQRTTVSATESELAHLAPSITGSDLSDCDDMRTHGEGPYDSIDSVPDKVRMESTYLNMKRDMVIQDFQESGIFEGDEDIKSITESTQTDKHHPDTYCMFQRQSTFDPLLLRRLSSEGSADSEKRLTKELEAKTKELERVQGDVRQLEHCMDCLRLQLDGGTPCYPLGQGFTDILDKVRKLQNDFYNITSKKDKGDAELEILRESQKEMAHQLNDIREKKIQAEEKYKEMKEEEEAAKLQLQRLHSESSETVVEVTESSETMVEVTEEDKVTKLEKELEHIRTQLKLSIVTTVLVSMWRNVQYSSMLELPLCEEQSTKNIPQHSTECQHKDREEFYTNQIQVLEKQKNQLKKQLEIYQNEQEIKTQDANNQLQLNNNVLQQKCYELEEEKAQLELQLQLLEEAVQKEKECSYKEKCQLHRDYRLRIDDLHDEINEHKKKCSHIENSLNNVMQELEIVPLCDDSTVLNFSYKHDDVLNKVRELMQTETTLRQKVYELEKKESAYRETLQEADKIMASVEARYCDRILEIENKEESVRQQLQHSEQNEHRLRQALRAATKGGEMFKVPDLLEKLIETESSELKLREQVHRLEHEENTLRMKTTETEKVAAELKEELQDQEEMVNQMNQLQKENSLLQTEIGSLKAQTKQMEELEDTMKLYKGRIDELEESELSLKKRVEQLIHNHESVQKRLEQDLCAYKEDLERNGAELQTSRKTTDTISRELVNVKERLTETEEELQLKKQQHDQYEASTRHEIAKLRQQLALANEQLSDLENLNCNLRDQLSQTEKKACEMNSEICELKHIHERSLLQLNLQLMHKDNELEQQEQKQFQMDGRELDALSQQESELKNVELRLRSLGQDLQKCCECGVLVAPVLESVTDDLRLLLTLICGEVASHYTTDTSSKKQIDELESSCEDLMSETIEDEVSISSKQQQHTNPVLKRVASLEQTLRQWEMEGDLLQAQLEQKENEVKQQNEEISRQQSIMEHLREKTIELYQKLDDHNKEFTSTVQDLQNRCASKNIIISVLASEAASTCGNIRRLISKLESPTLEKGMEVEDFNVELVKEFIQQWNVKTEQENCSNSRRSNLSRRKSLCDLLAHVKWDSIRASSETSLLPPGSSPSKIPRYIPLQIKEAEVQKQKSACKKKRVSLSSIHRSKMQNDHQEVRSESPVRQDFRERSPLEYNSIQLQPPQDFRITRKVGEDSIILAWTSLKDENVAGYQILVNGVVAQHVRSPQRNKALLPGLPLTRGLHLAIRALAVPKGNRAPVAGPPYAIRYDPRIQYNLPADCHTGGVQILRHAIPQLVFETEC